MTPTSRRHRPPQAVGAMAFAVALWAASQAATAQTANSNSGISSNTGISSSPGSNGVAGEPSQAEHDYRIAPGPLGQTLLAIAQQSGRTISVDPALVASRQAPGVQGRYTPEQAAQAALQGSGLALTRTASGVWSVTVAPASQRTEAPAGNDSSRGSRGGPATLAPVVVTARPDLPSGVEQVSGFVALRNQAGMKTDTPLARTPQSVSVVTRDQMDAQGATTLVESIRYTPGLVAQYGNTDLRLDWLTLRGFTPPARYLDQLRLPFGARGYAQPRIEPWGLERVEVVKGPSSVLYGQATPGGLINMVSKRPTLETVREVEVQAGSHRRRQAAFDLGGALDEEGVWSYRLVGLHRDADTPYDHVSERKSFIAPSLTWRPTSDTRVTLLAQWQSLDSPGGGGAPALPVAGTLDTRVHPALGTGTFVGEPGFDRFTNRQRFVGYEAEHRVDDTLTLRQNLRYGKVDARTQRVQTACQGACNPAALLRYAWAFPETSDLLTLDTQAQFDVRTGAVQHKVLAGLDYSREEAAFDETVLRILTSPFNAYRPVYGLDSGVVPPVATHIDQKRSQTGLYVQDQMQWNRWSAVLGLRHDRAHTDTDTLAAATGARTVQGQRDGEFTGRAAVLYAFDSGVTPYLSYSTSFQPTPGTDAASRSFDPTTGRQWEAGVKYQPPGSKALWTASVYELTQRNALTPSTTDPRYSEQTGEVRIRGLELEARAPLARRLDAIASYAYTDSEVTRANRNAAGASIRGNRVAYTPQHQVSAWLDYAFDADTLPGVSWGAGARRQSGTYGDAANAYRVPGVTLWDAAVRWDAGRAVPALKGVRLALNVSNLTDRTYVATCLSATGCYYGDRRNVYLTAGYRW